jgi:ABC-type nitrate/sulfonate/bicarbonate transport system ATPase subunit
LGYSLQINKNVYKHRASSSTTIDLLSHSTKEAIPLNDALAVLKQMGGKKDLISFPVTLIHDVDC